MINRKLELEKLLISLKKSDTENNSDIDLILGYLEECIHDPKLGGGSKKLQEFQVDQDPTTLNEIYHITWKKPINLKI
jgi:hypothetical protein